MPWRSRAGPWAARRLRIWPCARGIVRLPPTDRLRPARPAAARPTLRSRRGRAPPRRFPPAHRRDRATPASGWQGRSRAASPARPWTESSMPRACRGGSKSLTVPGFEAGDVTPHPHDKQNVGPRPVSPSVDGSRLTLDLSPRARLLRLLGERSRRRRTNSLSRGERPTRSIGAGEGSLAGCGQAPLTGQQP